MKKALSVLLVAAALFGFYGSAVTVNDLLACKDYWEEAGEKSTADMNKLEDGLNQLKDNEQAYLDGQGQLADAEEQLAAGEAKLAKGEADYAAAPAKLAAARSAIANGEAQLADGKETLAEGKSMLKQLKEGVAELNEKYPTWRHGNDVVHGRNFSDNPEQAALEQGLYGVANDPAGKVTKMGSMFSSGSLDGSKINKGLAAVKTQAVAGLNGDGTADNPGLIAVYLDGVTGGVAKAVVDSSYKENNIPIPESAEDEGYAAYMNAIADAKGDATVKAKAQAMVKSELGSLTATTDNVQSMLGVLIKKGVISNATGSPTAPLYSANSAMSAFDTLNQLVDGKKEIQDKLIPLLKKVKGNKDVEKIIGNVDKVIAGLNADDDTFMETMDEIMKAAPKLVSEVTKAVKKGEKDLAAGKKKLSAGKAQYAQGLKDYAAAPGQLEEGRQQLADGYKQYEDGKAQLAQYEDGEQQIRDGLATLFNTEADLELQSIADRLNGDGDFDNGDNHLEIEEGLNAVEVGRGYQAEDGVLITNEIMGRAVATGGLIGAAVLAVLAAILSFLKKNKGAAVFALLAAAAGAFGAFYGPAQGTYFSDIAGSTVGATTWVAAGVLGAVALVHAIAHFAAPKNA